MAELQGPPQARSGAGLETGEDQVTVVQLGCRSLPPALCCALMSEKNNTNTRKLPVMAEM